jgi:hypothetical protein
MVDVERRSYPSVPTRNWWDLRARFKQAVPNRVDADYLQAVLGVGEGHARNMVPQLKAVGLIDDSGTPTDLAHDWRDDKSYAETAAKIRDAIYPPGLRDALPPPNPDRGSVEAWFSRNVKVGEGAARKMASFYLLLCEANPAGQNAEAKAREPKPKATAGRKAETKKKTPAVQVTEPPRVEPKVETTNGTGPSLHVDVQVHIAPDASAEQIDQIFEAMAKHLYKR